MATNMREHMEEKRTKREGNIFLAAMGVMAALFASMVVYHIWFARPDREQVIDANSSSNQYTMPIAINSASATTYCTTAGGGMQCFYGSNGQSVTDDERYAFASLVPLEASRDKELRKAFREWIAKLPEGKPKAAYAAVLDEFDRNDQMVEQEHKNQQAAAALLKDAPQASCKKGAAGYECVNFQPEQASQSQRR